MDARIETAGTAATVCWSEWTPYRFNVVFWHSCCISVGEMHYDVIYVIVLLALLLIGGIVLIADAARRLFRGR